ncbi:MAG TPA: TonB-dependent receptor [Bacteroidales bacterium]|nr:TonB-dependent receptor [Bacteroidales bacterium]HRX96200.1 TonB-dependent receptor [Bacteroidales bacterium]
MKINKINGLKIWWIGVLVSISSFAFSQDFKVDPGFAGKPLQELINHVKTDSQIQFYIYPKDSLPEVLVKIPEGNTGILEVLNYSLKETGFNAFLGFDNQIFIIRGKQLATEFPSGFFENENSNTEDTDVIQSKSQNEFLNTDDKFITREITIGNEKDGRGKKTFVLQGTVSNEKTKQPIVNGNIYISELERGVLTGNDGRFYIELKKGTYTIRFSSLESIEQNYKVTLLSDGELDVLLPTKSYQLSEVVVSSSRNHNVSGSQMGFERITVKQIKEIPVVMGERDLIKVALLLPGVQSVGEGSSGFNVRGSPVDQNLFYINRVPVYNSSHLFGFFSVFNADAVSEFTLLKGNIPAQYGGRLSSIFDITAHEGRKDKFSMKGGISPITANVMLEGPLQKDKSSYMLSFRSTYSDWILGRTRNLTLKNSSAFFGDLMAGFSIQLDPKNEINIFGYYSYDDADIAGLTTNKYQNQGGSVLWKRVVNEKHTFDLSLASTTYNFENQNLEYDYAAYKQQFDLMHHEIKSSFTYRPNHQHAVQVGLDAILYNTKRGDLKPASESSEIKPQSYEPEQATELGFFISDQWNISKKLEATAGLRFNLYNYWGPKTVYSYYEGLPVESQYITDTTYFAKNTNIKSYSNPDYRIGLKYLISENLSVKAGYNRLHQYIFMLSNTVAVSPTDTWKLADSHIEPMTGDQLSAGVYTNILGGFLEFSLEGYLKKVNNLVEYKDGANLVSAENPETEIIQGELNAYGIEFMVRKPRGDLNGWVNYTYSKSEIRAVNEITGEQNNLGFTYPANFDKPHSFNLVANYKLSKRLSFSGSVVYSTGRTITYPTALYYLNGIEITHYSQRNQYRLPDYFRVDVAMNFEGNLKRNKLIHGSWSFSVYNLTGRKNAYSVFFSNEGGEIKAYRLSVFGVPIFSVTYNFKLGNYDN